MEIKLSNDSSLHIFTWRLYKYLKYRNRLVNYSVVVIRSNDSILWPNIHELITELMHFRGCYLNCSQLLTGVLVLYSVLSFNVVRKAYLFLLTLAPVTLLIVLLSLQLVLEWFQENRILIDTVKPVLISCISWCWNVRDLSILKSVTKSHVQL